MSLLRNAIKSNFSLRALQPNNALPSFLLDSPKRFSTDSEQPTPSPPEASPVDQFLQTPNSGFVYCKLTGATTKFTQKTDIINLLEGSDLTPDDIKVSYSRNFMPVGMMVQFPSRRALDNAFKEINKKGRLYKLEKVDRSQWELLKPYDGKAVLLQGLPRFALAEDVERFLSGCEYDASSMQFIQRAGFPDQDKLAVVRFPSQIQAMNAFITKNRGFCLNSQILMRVLQ